jgi:predicted PolB exonuclease-like 3'-5' exonuclease
MQTFLPYVDFTESVKILDRQRLGKQRVETYQILKALLQGGGLHGGWARHPASRMWEGYELALLKYQEETCKEWVINRGYKDTCWQKSYKLFSEEDQQKYENNDYSYPEWLGDEAFHKAHKSNLNRKAPELYKRLFPDVPDDLPYIWPGLSLREAVTKQE